MRFKYDENLQKISKKEGLVYLVIALIAILGLVFSVKMAKADIIEVINFNTFDIGEANGQNGWTTSSDGDWQIKESEFCLYSRCLTTDVDSGLGTIYSYFASTTQGSMKVEYYVEEDADGLYQIQTARGGSTIINFQNQMDNPYTFTPVGDNATLPNVTSDAFTTLILNWDCVSQADCEYSYTVFNNLGFIGSKATSSDGTFDYFDRIDFGGNNANENIWYSRIQISDEEYEFGFGISDPDEWFYDYISQRSMSVPEYLTCIIGQECNLEFSYPTSKVGDRVYLFASTSPLLLPGEEYASTTLTYSLTNTKRFSLASSSIEQLESYYLVNIDNEVNNFYETYHIIVSFVELGIEDVLWTAYNADPCEDVASSTGIFTSFKSDVECALKKAIHWAIVPHPKYYTNLQNSVLNLKKEFPLNIYGNIKDSFDTYASTTATTSASIELTGFGGIFEEHGGVTLDFSTIDDGDRSTLFYYIREAFNILLWVSLLTYFIFRFLAIAKKNDNENI